MGAVYRANETDTSAVDRLMAVVGMDNIRVSAHVPAVANKKQNAVIRLGMRRDMVCPMWAGRLAHLRRDHRPDEGRDQHHGRLIFTTKILRPGGFWKQESQIP